jgi:integrase/recombinase XerD
MILERGNALEDYDRWLKSYRRIQKNHEMSKNTIEIYNRVLNRLRSYIESRNDIKSIKDIDREFFMDFLEDYEEQSKKGYFSKQTKKTYIAILKSFFIYISDHNVDGDGTYGYESDFKNLAPKKIKKSTKVKDLSDEEKIKLLDYLESQLETGKHYAFIHSLGIKLMLLSGLRISETLSLRLSDFSISDEVDDHGEHDLYEIRLRETKSGVEQFVLIAIDDIKKELEYFRVFLSEEDDIFKGLGSKKRIDRSNFYRSAGEVMRKAGIDKKGLHIFRHTCAMNLYRKTRDVLVTKERLRHASINTTMIYANAQKSDVAKAIR